MRYYMQFVLPRPRWLATELALKIHALGLFGGDDATCTCQLAVCNFDQSCNLEALKYRGFLWFQGQAFMALLLIYVFLHYIFASQAWWYM